MQKLKQKQIQRKWTQMEKYNNLLKKQIKHKEEQYFSQIDTTVDLPQHYTIQ